MKSEELLAPEHYNLVSEMEHFAKNPEKVAVLWENEKGDKKQLHMRINKKVQIKLEMSF